MGRTFRSVRMAVKDLAARWLSASKALKKEDEIYGEKLAEMTMMHSSAAFCAMSDRLEAATFSALVEILKEIDQLKKKE